MCLPDAGPGGSATSTGSCTSSTVRTWSSYRPVRTTRHSTPSDDVVHEARQPPAACPVSDRRVTTSVRQKCYLGKVRLSWTAAARRHQIARADARFVIEHCGLVFIQPAPDDSPVPDDRFVYLGDDPAGRPLEVVAVEVDSGSAGDRRRHLRVIHAMELRAKYRSQYEEARRWRV